MELRRRGEVGAGAQFVSGLKSLHRRRTLGNVGLPTSDLHSDEHRLTPDPYLSELWRSYKRAICANRTGPAAQLLRELEQQLQAH